MMLRYRVLDFNPKYFISNKGFIVSLVGNFHILRPRYDKNGTLINENTSRIYNLTYNGKPLDLKQEFLIATNNYRAGGNSFPWQGRQEIVYSSTDETRDVLKNHIHKNCK